MSSQTFTRPSRRIGRRTITGMAVIGVLIGAGVAGAGPASASPRHGAGRHHPGQGAVSETLPLPEPGSSCAGGKAGAASFGTTGAVHVTRTSAAGGVAVRAVPGRPGKPAGIVTLTQAKASGRSAPGKGMPASIEVRLACVNGKIVVSTRAGGKASGPVHLATPSGDESGAGGESSRSEDCDD